MAYLMLPRFGSGGGDCDRELRAGRRARLCNCFSVVNWPKAPRCVHASVLCSIRLLSGVAVCITSLHVFVYICRMLLCAVLVKFDHESIAVLMAVSLRV